MLKRIWQQLVRLFQRWFGRRWNQTPPPVRQEPPPELTDGDLESLFMQLLEGVHQQQGQAWALKYLKNIEHRVTTERWVEWLRRFGERLLASRAPNNELAARMVQLGELRIGEVGDAAYEIGMHLLTRNPGEPIWEYDGPDAEPVEPPNQEGEAQAIRLDELLVRLQQDANLRQQVVQQLGIDTDDPQVIIQALINQLNAAGQSTTDDAEAWFNQGNRQCEAGDFEGAIASYDQAIKFKPDYHQAWYMRSLALGSLGRYEEEIASCDKAIEFQPNKYEAWDSRGIALGSLGRYEEAIASFDKAIEFQPDKYEAWSVRGMALEHLGRYEEVIASCDKAIEFNADDHLSWSNRGMALGSLGRYEEAIASYDKAIAIKPDDSAWYNQGNALGKLERYEEAIASYDKAIEFNPDFPEAWTNRGLMLVNLGLYEEGLVSLERALAINLNFPEVFNAHNGRGVALHNLEEYEQAIASYDKAIAIKPDFDPAWIGRGIAAGYSVSCDPLLASLSPIARQNPALNQRVYEGALASYEEGLKHCQQDTHPEGWGRLHQAIGNAHYFRGLGDSHACSYWRKAVRSYNQALLTLTEADFPKLHLRVLQDLIRALSGLGQTAEAEELQRRGTDLLQRLLKEPNRLEHSKKQLALKFAGFGQLTVDLTVQSGNWGAALEIAEQGKNACLSWILGAWSDEVSSPKWKEIKQLLNPTTAAVYWHLSPGALHAFILKHDAPSPILITTPTQTTGEELPAAVRRLRDFENWVKDWNQQYANYRKGKDKQVEAENNWRDNLPEMLQQLANILDIPAIVELIQNPKSKIQNLILIPHRDLHRFPLHALFSDNFTITYLPSAQIGITLQQIPPTPLIKGGKGGSQQLLSVEHPNSQGLPSLEFAQIESEAISQMFPNPTRIRSEQATKKAIEIALLQGHSIFHFTGHGTYNFSNPALSHLALAGEEKLTLTDICAPTNNLTSYRLISLAACETAITGNHSITTEYVGLVSAFIRCGVAHVISTLWTVESAASALVMIQFYQLLKQGKPEAVALTEATQWLRNVTADGLKDWYEAEIAKLPADEGIVHPFLQDQLDDISTMEAKHQPYNHPYYWVAFTITGGFPSCNL